MKNALLGYTYQHYVAFLFLAKMDVDREIEKVTLEATTVTHQFDDIRVEIGMTDYYLQIKDFKQADIGSLTIINGNVFIGGISHRLSSDINVIFFKQIDYVANTELFGFPAYEFSGIYVVSLSRGEIDKEINRLYRKDLRRKAIMEQFFAVEMDKRTMEFEKFRLPLITVYSTKLSERTVKISRRLLKFNDILFIEGKPGIGKSHLVSVLQDQFKSNVLYRFWISNQDADYEGRLKYFNFLTDLSKKLFNDYKDHDEADIFTMLHNRGATLIIDGLDHVENYNNKDLKNFINFIEIAHRHCKVIVLSRPLLTRIMWKKQLLTNWNEEQTQKVLSGLYFIDDYLTAEKIYLVTAGYPILVSYIAQQYKKEGVIAHASTYHSINNYYDSLLKDEKGKRALSIFLCSRGFLMRSELRLFLSDYSLDFVTEFIEEHPYLFELRLNRISLFHDSLITYLRKSGINYEILQVNFNQVVYKSLLNGEKRFQSRIGHFDLSLAEVRCLIKWYSSIDNFRAIMTGVIDFEAIREFYQQLRNMLSLLYPQELEVIEYYDLTLIINLTQRDHVSTIQEFQYTYVLALLYNGYTEEDITSNKYLFAMWYYIKTNDITLLVNSASNDMYDTANFHLQLAKDLDKEKRFFEIQNAPFEVESIKRALKDSSSLEFRTNLEDILVNLYLHETNRNPFDKLYRAIKIYMSKDEQRGIALLIDAISNRSLDYHQASYTLSNVKKTLLAQGIEPDSNDYRQLSLKQYLAKHGHKGSFTLWPEILSYLRLSLELGKKIDISSISSFWIKYYQRKDYSLFSLDLILTVFEHKRWIPWKSSVKIITEIQEVSEKGYRDLLARYIMAHKPEFIHSLLAEFNPNELRISWFDLDTAYLNVLPEYICKSELMDLLKYNFGEAISIDKFRNVLTSNKLPLLQIYLRIYQCQIRVNPNDRDLKLLKEQGISFVEHKDAHDELQKDTPENRFNQGLLDLTNVRLIKRKRLSPGQVAATGNGDYTALAEPELFAQFSKSRIKRDFKEILFNGITGKSKHSDYYHVLWVMPGSVLKIMLDNKISIPKELFRSFQTYLEVSLI